eukprot:jgi/Botrbrau1/20266/Bobra.31_1s0051.1
MQHSVRFVEDLGSNFNLDVQRARTALSLFVEDNENPSNMTFVTSIEHSVDRLTALLIGLDSAESEDLVTLILKALKILTRIEVNRKALTYKNLHAVALHLQTPFSPQVAAEAANVLLNACYEKQHVLWAIESNTVPCLIRLLSDGSNNVQANVAGALQSISFQAKGRQCVRNDGAVEPLLRLLERKDNKVISRAIGALHNLSADTACLKLIRQAGGIPRLVQLVRAEDIHIAASAAGTLQNLSREVASRILIKEEGAVSALTPLLLTPLVQAQVCAAGALLNIMGPDLERGFSGADNGRCHALAQILGTAMAGAAVHNHLQASTAATLT